MTKQLTYWLDWKTKSIKPNKRGLQEIPWVELENYPLTVFCSQNDWPYLRREFDQQKIIIDENKRTYQIGKAIIKELRGADEENPESSGMQALKKCFELCKDFVNEHPSHDKETFEAIKGWVFPPRFENLQQGVFKDVYQIDIKSCHASIMRNYPLPWGEPTHITDPEQIEQAIKEKKTGLIRFLLKTPAIIKNNQIPFVPDYNNNIKEEIKGRFLLYTRLFHTFKKQYKIKGKILYTDFWIWEEKRGCVNQYLDYCEQIKETDPKRGKMLANVLYGSLGKNKFGGYNYRVWTIAVNHLAILQTYYLYRQFKPEQVLAIRSDCIYVQGELPESLLKEKQKYQMTKYQKIGLQGSENIFIYDQQELKARQTKGDQARQKLLDLFINLRK